MGSPQIRIAEESFGKTTRGLVVGVIYFDFGQYEFPEKNWSDAVAVVLEWWISALSNFLNGSASSVELRFMEGDFRISCRRTIDGEFVLECIGGGEKIEFGCAPVEVLISALEAAVRVQMMCEKLGWESDDTEKLQHAIAGARFLLNRL